MFNIFLLALGILGAISGAVLITHWLRGVLYDRAFRRLFPFSEQDTVIVVCPTRGGKTPDATTLTYEDSLAQAAFQTAFVRHGIKQMVKLHTHITNSERRHHLVTICGIWNNSVTAAMHDRLPFRFVKQPDGQVTICDLDGHPMHPSSNSKAVDHAVVAVVPNPWSDPQHPTLVYVVAGIHRLGTWAAAKLLVFESARILNHLKAERLASSPPRFAALIRARERGAFEPEAHISHVSRA